MLGSSHEKCPLSCDEFKIHFLSFCCLFQLFLGDYPFKRFTESNVLNYIERFQRKLEGIGGEIDVRNESLDVPYTYMLPKKIPNSITI